MSNQSPLASQHRRSKYTDPQMAVFAALNEAVVKDPTFKNVILNCDYLSVESPTDTRRDGTPKQFWPDIPLIDPKSGARIALEIYGEGTASDNQARDEALKVNGWLLVVRSNKEPPLSVVRDIRRMLKILRSLD